ncbi:hypothetical protein CcaverHIS002_0111250 [Cutaneotrichosporon cavernicola]|uniref:Uncharacterized protein n=1 Tax=Cutaneotrichosporon cavernicola TaxID=279322 RepID=A0AA48ICK3_9TREE|nr:uncharacterized protein CcaverHIS019_0111140 [Cutaneotrichosporon cavernicola]BEI80596.1 hypothetical protein CcaverHIS002_0111250 [Cutaneotrichosporon cavernicola]BEI88396.1 hypothetical protein CcaverHIS019_0111140 [Cutaneotrichosporon cavernicola]BEI96169.1 hypothetical protein CcaverHIS631_0111180 [Cutaneotrichosporon cavernicola]BEJ03941.1 hypothetical protein CcaverHIS641_0111160 [Cutaneotrichosporon cavernicola]
MFLTLQTMSPPVTNDGKANSFISRNPAPTKVKGFGNRNAAVTVSVPGSFLSSRPLGPPQERHHLNFRQPPILKRQPVVDATSKDSQAKIEELEQEDGADQHGTPLTDLPNVPRSHFHRSTQATQQPSAEVPAIKPTFRRHGSRRPVSSFEDDAAKSGSLAQPTRANTDRGVTQIRQPPHQSLPSHEYGYDEEAYGDADIQDSIGDFQPATVLIHPGTVWQDTHVDDNDLELDDTHDHQLHLSDSVPHRSSDSSRQSLFFDGPAQAPNSQGAQVATPRRGTNHGTHIQVNDSTFSDGSEAGGLHPNSRTSGHMGRAVPGRQLKTVAAGEVRRNFSAQQHHLPQHRVPFGKSSAQLRQPSELHGQQPLRLPRGQMRQDGQPVHGMPAHARGHSSGVHPQSRPQTMQQTLFSGNKFSSPNGPLQNINLAAIWQSAYREAKRQREAPSFDLHLALENYQKDINRTVGKMTDFLYNLQSEQQGLEAEVEKSVRKLEYKTTLYDKAREETASVGRTAKPWEAKRSGQ